MSLAGQKGKLQLTGTATAMTDEPMSDTGNGTLWTIDDDAKFLFDPAATFTVEVDSGTGFSTVAASSYTLRYLVGAVDFDSSQSGNTVRISGSYLPRHTVAEVTTSDHSFSAGVIETPQYQDEGVRRIPGVQDYTGSFTSFLEVESEIDAPTDSEGSLLEFLLGEEIDGAGSIGRDIVLVFDKDGAVTERRAGFVNLNESSRSSSPSDAQEHDLTFEANQQDATMSTQSVRIFDRLES